jgi:pantoate kinase
MKAVAFAPAHISGFFEPVYNKDIYKTGSRGAGINLSLGVTSTVILSDSNKQIIDININDKESLSPVINLAIKKLIGKKKFLIEANIIQDLPIGQGFGISAASAVSVNYAIAKIIKSTKCDAMKASHFAEVKLKTGLGDVAACCFGGVEIRKEPGIPPWGLLNHIPGEYNLVLCIIDEKIDTKKILTNPNIMKNVKKFGKICTNKLINKPTIENLFLYSKYFKNKTNLAKKEVDNAIESIDKYGMASMCMLGNSVFAIGETINISKELSKYGNVYSCVTDNFGARIINK